MFLELMENRYNNYSIKELLDANCSDCKAKLDKLWESEAYNPYDEEFDINGVIGNSEKITSSLFDYNFTKDVALFEIPVAEP